MRGFSKNMTAQYLVNQNGECRPCGKMITTAGTVKSSGSTVRLRQNTDCTTENLVYLISCSSCNK